MPIFLYTIGVLALTIGLAVFSYLDRAYREFGHVTTGRIHRHLETFEAEVEPRFKMVKVTLVAETPTDRSLRFHIEALMYAEPAPERVSFDSLLDPANQSFSVVGGT